MRNITKGMVFLDFFSIILLDHMLYRVPKVSGRIEKFYTKIVQKIDDDPSVVAQSRGTSEACSSLRRSSVILYSYIIKEAITLKKGCQKSVILILIAIFSIKSIRNEKKSWDVP